MPYPYLRVGDREDRCSRVELAHQAGLGHAERLLLHRLDTRAHAYSSTAKLNKTKVNGKDHRNRPAPHSHLPLIMWKEFNDQGEASNLPRG